MRSKKKPDPTDALNLVMNTYRDSVLPTPIIMWRTEGKTVAAWELTQEQFDAVMKVFSSEK
jgi:hypothetical protein